MCSTMYISRVSPSIPICLVLSRSVEFYLLKRWTADKSVSRRREEERVTTTLRGLLVDGFILATLRQACISSIVIGTETSSHSCCIILSQFSVRDSGMPCTSMCQAWDNFSILSSLLCICYMLLWSSCLSDSILLITAFSFWASATTKSVVFVNSSTAGCFSYETRAAISFRRAARMSLAKVTEYAASFYPTVCWPSQVWVLW